MLSGVGAGVGVVGGTTVGVVGVTGARVVVVGIVIFVTVCSQFEMGLPYVANQLISARVFAMV